MVATTRLALNKPQNTDVVDVTTAMSNQYAQLDNDAIVQNCTAATRPSAPYTGKLIYETDTDNIMEFDGGSWVLVTNDNNPRGRVAFTSQTSTSATIAQAGEILIMSRTFTSYAGRRYGVYAGGGVDMVAGNDASNFSRLRWAAGSSVSTSSTEFCTQGADCNENTTGGIMRFETLGVVFPNVTGTITIGLFFGRPANGDAKTVNVREYQWLGIEDIGS